MATYTYDCPYHGLRELQFPMGAAPATAPCPNVKVVARLDGGELELPCGRTTTRALYADLLTLHVSNDDEIRQAYLKSDFESNIAAQGRRPDPLMPRDKIEARAVRAKTGRVYCGSDTSQLSAAGQRAIAKGERKEYAYQNGGGLGDD